MSLVTIQKQLQTVTSLISDMELRAAADRRPSTLANIRALQKERRVLEEQFNELAKREDVEVCRYKLLNSAPVTIRELTDAWVRFQEAFGALYLSFKAGGAPTAGKNKKSNGTKAQHDYPQLVFAFSFPGSVGVVLTLSPSDDSRLFADPIVAQAAESLFAMIESKSNEESVVETARRYGPIPSRAVYNWINSHVEHNLGLDLEWRLKTQILRVNATVSELTELRTGLARTSVETKLELTGDLIAVDFQNRTFRLHTDTGGNIEGEFDDAISYDQTATLPRRYTVVVLKKTPVVQEQGKQETYFLRELRPLT